MQNPRFIDIGTSCQGRQHNDIPSEHILLTMERCCRFVHFRQRRSVSYQLIYRREFLTFSERLPTVHQSLGIKITDRRCIYSILKTEYETSTLFCFPFLLRGGCIMASDSIRKSLRSDFRKYPPVLTVKQVCEIIELRPTRVYGMIKKGKIPKIEHCGRHIRVLKADLIEFLIAHKNNS